MRALYLDAKLTLRRKGGLPMQVSAELGTLISMRSEVKDKKQHGNKPLNMCMIP